MNTKNEIKFRASDKIRMWMSVTSYSFCLCKLILDILVKPLLEQQMQNHTHLLINVYSKHTCTMWLIKRKQSSKHILSLPNKIRTIRRTKVFHWKHPFLLSKGGFCWYWIVFSSFLIIYLLWYWAYHWMQSQLSFNVHYLVQILTLSTLKTITTYSLPKWSNVACFVLIS